MAGACGGSPTSPSEDSAPPLPTATAAVSGGRASVTIANVPALGSSGGAALVQAGSSNFLVSRAGDTFAVLTAVCTHEGCTVSGFENSVYVCPCHGSQYSTSGAVVRGPANRALAQIASQFVDGVLSFSA